MQYPWIDAMRGLRTVSKASSQIVPGRRAAVVVGPVGRSSFRSAPAQKPRGPAPRSRMTRTPGSPSSSRNASGTSRRMASLIALIESGRFRVMHATPASRPTSIASRRVVSIIVYLVTPAVN
jgi:hypothetical protein